MFLLSRVIPVPIHGNIMRATKLSWFVLSVILKDLLSVLAAFPRLEQILNQVLCVKVVSLAAVFWMSRNAPPKEGGALRDTQKTAARETSVKGDPGNNQE